ncbi:MAG: hypothetical protein ABFS45_19020 [Pseudomonadota bacterium]
MSKTIVIKQPEGDRAPFLRGILVQSLVRKGLSFEDAYALAQEVRDQLRDTKEISSKLLRVRVAEALENRFGMKLRQAYEAKPQKSKEVIVNTSTRSAPFSVGILTHCLESCAIAPELALEGARHVHDALNATGHKEISHRALRRIIYECLKLHVDEKKANRYLSWRQFQNSGKPLILLVGGISGAGKSTVTAEVAYRMDIVRTQSTDIMREIIRCYLAPHVVPTLGYSSFEAWRGMPTIKRSGRREVDNPVISGFLSQFGKVKVALEATINRALDEGQPLIVDGVLVLPWELELEELSKRAIVVPVMLAVMRKKLLAKQLKARGREQSARKASRYLEHLDDIWELQSYLLSQADQAGIPIIPNWSMETTVREVLELISQKIMSRYPPDPHALV